jgi:enoyl-CoA hydratase/carnithine racemase
MVHPREALRIALMGNDERVSAETALRIGLVSEITSRAELWSRAHEIAALIASKPSVATQGAVRAVWESLDKGRQASLDHGIIYNRIGNPIGEAQVDRWNLKQRKWSLR